MKTSNRAPKNFYVHLANEIARSISEGEVLPGSLLPTERELQDRYGVSRTTVRRAIGKIVADGWGKFEPHRGVIAMDGISRKVHRKIGLISRDTFVTDCLYARFQELFGGLGYEVHFFPGAEQTQMEDPLEQVVNEGWAGAILWSYRGFPDEEKMNRLSCAIPGVQLIHAIPGFRGDLVTFDDEGAAYEATMHLVSQGCRSVAVSGMMDMLSSSHAKFCGYLKALFASGIQPHPRDFLFSKTSGMASADGHILRNRLQDTSPPDGLLILDDISAPPAVEACMKAGLTLPGQIKIVALGDDVDLQVNGIGMSAIAYDWDGLARLAVECLVERIERSIRPPRTSRAPHHLIVRGLCGVPQSEWTENPDFLSGFHGSGPIPRLQVRFSSSWSVQESSPHP